MRLFAIPLMMLAATALGQTDLKKLYEEKRFEEVSKIAKGIDDDQSNYATAQYYLGRISFDQKNFDDAADYFQEATEAKGGQQSDYYTWLGDAYGSIAGNANVIRQGMLAPKMKNAWEKAIALDDKNIRARISLIEFYTKAPSLMGGSRDKAKEMAKQVMLINPVQGHRSMGNLLVEEKNIDGAEKEYLEMVKLDPNLTPFLGNFYLNQKKYDKAFALFDEAVKKNPNDMAAIYQTGKTCAASGQRLDMGEEYLLKYLTYTPKPNEPSHAGANMRLAQIYEKKGKKSEAKSRYETALRLDNSLQEAKDGLSRVSK
jgi:tetratricopeptide (TPR) repeat protein